MKIWKTIFTLAKILTIIVSISYIFWKVYTEIKSGVLFNELYNLNFGDIVIIVIVFVLVFANWLLESIKFSYLVKPIQEITIKQSIKGILAGVAVSIFTPKRVGDFGGRIFILESKNRVAGIFATLLGSLSQFLVTLFVGLALFPLYYKLTDFIKDRVSNILLLYFIAFVVIVILLYIYFNISKAAYYLYKFKFFVKHKDFILFFKSYKNWELGRVLFISFLRYAVFTLQFFLLLKIFDGNISYFEAIIGISQVYLFMTIVPTFALGELGVRSSVSLWILGVFIATSSGIIAASMFLWLLNLALPALLGSYFLSKFKV